MSVVFILTSNPALSILKSMAAHPETKPKTSSARKSVLVQTFTRIAEWGNRLPDPLTMFVILILIVVVLSGILNGVSAEVVQRDGSSTTKTVESLLSVEGIRWMLTSAVDNFIRFAPLGPVLVVMIGIGVAERTGYIAMGLRVMVKLVPPQLLTAALVFGGVMSSMAADAGYVVLTPLGAVLFAGLGRHPIAGLAAAFAGVSGGFSANLFITALDPLLATLTQQAASTVDPTYAEGINAASNWYFMVASTFLITAVGTFVTTRIVEPTLGPWIPEDDSECLSTDEPTPSETRNFFTAVATSGIVLIGILGLVAIPGAPLRGPSRDGHLLTELAPFFDSLEVLVATLFIVPGVVFGVLQKKIRTDKDIAKMASDSMASMGAYVVLAFVAGQFVAYFNHTHLGTVTAVKGATLLQELGLQGIPLLMMFILVSSVMNLFVGSASAKWAFMAPTFVPMLMISGLSPELVQAGYRVGDSVTNIISPLMPYLPIIIIFARKYDKKAGLGTLLSSMLPYSLAFGLSWILMLILWLTLDLPLGPGVEAFYSAAPATGP